MRAENQDTQAPPGPVGVTVHAGSSTSVHLMWKRAVDEAGVTGYEVYQEGAKVKDVPGGRNMVDVTGLEPSAAYTFTVRARDAAGNLSPRSADAPVTMLSAAVEDDKAPTRPENLRGRAGGARSATLAGERSTDNLGVTSYDVYQDDSKIHSVNGDETTALVAGLRPGTDCTFTVVARDTADNVSAESSTLDVTTASAPEDGPSTEPAGFRVTTHVAGGTHYLDLSWVPPKTGEEVKEYQIHLDGEFTTTLVWEAGSDGSRATHSFSVSEKPGTTYTVRIRAKLPDGNWGAFSARQTVTTGSGHS